MFQTNPLSYTYGIDKYSQFTKATATDSNVSALHDVWVKHLLHEQEQVDELQAKRHPLQLALEKNFLAA
jgi:hypothetical protein